jgi:hypothetical protein
MIRGIHHLAVNTANFGVMIDFYRRAFGFEQVGTSFSWTNNEFVDSVIGVTGSAARTVMLKPGNVYLEVFEYSPPPPREGEPLPQFTARTQTAISSKSSICASGMISNRCFAAGERTHGEGPPGAIRQIRMMGGEILPRHR